jgi:hypothetical protein
LLGPCVSVVAPRVADDLACGIIAKAQSGVVGGTRDIMGEAAAPTKRKAGASASRQP